ncbi:hypothetical protein JOL62DRAFT_557199 [Phyllosticta paracitricarpa]|uniref:Uncharacterized protein n=1 Tax=Phyllosticta paracitricarpa TaxID=2016321 RepID=A0ABR1N529_9PEZI
MACAAWPSPASCCLPCLPACLRPTTLFRFAVSFRRSASSRLVSSPLFSSLLSRRFGSPVAAFACVPVTNQTNQPTNQPTYYRPAVPSRLFFVSNHVWARRRRLSMTARDEGMQLRGERGYSYIGLLNIRKINFNYKRVFKIFKNIR